MRQNFERHRQQLEQRSPDARELIYREVLEVPRLCREAELLLKSSVATLGRWIVLYSDRVVLSDYPHLDRELGRTPSAGLELDETALKATCPDLDIEGPAFLLSGVASFLATALFGPVGLLAGLLLHGSLVPPLALAGAAVGVLAKLLHSRRQRDELLAEATRVFQQMAEQIRREAKPRFAEWLRQNTEYRLARLRELARQRFPGAPIPEDLAELERQLEAYCTAVERFLGPARA